MVFLLLLLFFVPIAFGVAFITKPRKAALVPVVLPAFSGGQVVRFRSHSGLLMAAEVLTAEHGDVYVIRRRGHRHAGAFRRHALQLTTM